jgi:hypothetical protein
MVQDQTRQKVSENPTLTNGWVKHAPVIPSYTGAGIGRTAVPGQSRVGGLFKRDSILKENAGCGGTPVIPGRWEV